jgi:hypothetical protein
VIVCAKLISSDPLLIATPPKFKFTTTFHICSFGTIFHEVFGTNNSGQFSPTIYGVFAETGHHVAFHVIRHFTVSNAPETAPPMSAPTFCARLNALFKLSTNQSIFSFAFCTAFTKNVQILSARRSKKSPNAPTMILKS